MENLTQSFANALAILRGVAAPVFALADRAPRWLRPVLVFVAAFAFSWWFIHFQVPGRPANVPDFTIFHAAGTPGPVYDAVWLTRLQGAEALRPFAYPPTFLLICRPLALLPLPIAYCLWNAIGAVMLVEATARIVPRCPWLVLFSPLWWLTAVLGQTPAFLGALIVFGMTQLHRPRLAGVLMGVAFAIKPQVMLLLPVALAFGGYWRALFFLGLGGLALCVVSLALGPHLWLDWIASLRAFDTINREVYGVWKMSAQMPYLPFAVVGALVCLWFGMKGDDATRLVAIIGGSLLISPHAQSYETAMLVPAALAMLMTAQWRSLAAWSMLYVRFVQPWGLALYVLAAVFGAHRKLPRLGPRTGLRAGR